MAQRVKQVIDHSNWTPKNMKALELILQHVQAGEKILVGSDLIETGRWLCERLKEKGVRAGHIVEERDGKAATVNPRKRAAVMRNFRHGSLQVLLCGIPAIRLGHNLDTASVVIVDGLVFSHATSRCRHWRRSAKQSSWSCSPHSRPRSSSPVRMSTD